VEEHHPFYFNRIRFQTLTPILIKVRVFAKTERIHERITL